MILYLQHYLYQQLTNAIITDKITGIYYQVPANSNFPYIYLGDFHSKDASVKDKEKLIISFKLSIYLRDKSIKAMLELAQDIKLILKSNKLVMIKCFEEKIILQNDGVTQVIMLLFKVRL